MLASNASIVATSDLNRDGVPDLIVGRYPEPDNFLGVVSVLQGRGNGNFQPEVKYNVGYSQQGIPAPFIKRIQVADVNDDSYPDIIVTHNDRQSGYGFSRLLLTVLLNRGDGTLQPAESRFFALDSSEKIRVEDVVVGDYNNDGKKDILVICSDETRFAFIYFVKNTGDGNFQITGLQEIGAFMYRGVSGYFNNDANLDLAVGTDQGTIFLFGSGNLVFSGSEQKESNQEIFNVITDDFNGDGRVDVAAVDRVNSTIRVFLRDQNGFPDIPIVRQLPGIFASTVKSADLNNDGRIDLAIVDTQNKRIGFLTGNGDGSFQAPVWIADSNAPSDLATADFDRDGKIDLAASTFNVAPREQLAVYLNSPNPQRYYNDFDGDHHADIGVFRPGNGYWYILRSVDYSFYSQQFGLVDDKLAPGNYDDDDKTDLAVFRSGIWFIWQSTTNSLKIEYWGTNGDIPVQGDYDSDGVMDVAVYRPTTGTWYVRLKNNAVRYIQWGAASDLPVANDYDGDGKVDIAVWRPSNGTWYILQSSNNEVRYQQFGLIGDQPVVGDFDGDGRADVAVFRGQNGLGIWYILQSSNNQFIGEQFGLANDLPLTGDFSGDSKNDLAVFRPGNGYWFMQKSENRQLMSIQWGLSTDRPTSSIQ